MSKYLCHSCFECLIFMKIQHFRWANRGFTRGQWLSSCSGLLIGMSQVNNQLGFFDTCTHKQKTNAKDVRGIEYFYLSNCPMEFANMALECWEGTTLFYSFYSSCRWNFRQIQSTSQVICSRYNCTIN